MAPESLVKLTRRHETEKPALGFHLSLNVGENLRAAAQVVLHVVEAAFFAAELPGNASAVYLELLESQGSRERGVAAGQRLSTLYVDLGSGPRVGVFADKGRTEAVVFVSEPVYPGPAVEP